MRLNLKYPEERVPLSWDFRKELEGHAVKTVEVKVSLDRGSRIEDLAADKLIASNYWVEDGVVFQLVEEGGVVGADYRFEALLKRDDGQIYKKVSILPIREA